MEEFCNNQIVYDACVLNFINIGEQTKSLSEKFQNNHPEIPYKKIIGLRNIAADSYEGLEPFRLFKVIEDDVPALFSQFSEILESGELE